MCPNSNTQPVILPPDALTSNGVLVDYLHILKDLKTEMNHVQSFLDAHIGFLEDLSQKQQDQESDKGCNAVFVLF